MTREDVFELLHSEYGVCPTCGRPKSQCNESANSELGNKVLVDISWLWSKLGELETCKGDTEVNYPEGV